MNGLAQKILPLGLINFLRELRSSHQWVGSYPSWGIAAEKCKGYESEIILSSVKEAVTQVINGIAIFERDSVLFYKEDYVWPLLSILLETAVKNHGKLRVIDFGGALGSTYFQHRKWIKNVPELRWAIVEQSNFVECGKSLVKDAGLSFHHSIENASLGHPPQVIIFSSVLQYLPDPWTILQESIKSNPDAIVIDRTGFVKSGKERISIQKVPTTIYKATYPCRFFALDELVNYLSDSYSLELTYPAIDRPILGAYFSGLYFKRKEK
jgi:putative methyltransferase (TIGR04325 family)